MDKLKEHYQELFNEHQFSPKSLDWSGKESQHQRFEVIASFLPDHDFSLTDVGCGFGDFYWYLLNKLYPLTAYTGIDLMEEFITKARNRASQREAKFLVQDASKQVPQADYCILSGSLNIRVTHFRNEQYHWAFTILKNMWEACNEGVIFNMLSSKFDIEAPDSFGYVPEVLMQFCTQFSTQFVLKHDYFPHDFTMAVFKE